MTLWIWLVAAIVFGLVIIEMFNWFKRKSVPVDAVGVGEEPGAELVRAQMKIAILEDRLAQSQTLLEEEKEELHARYRERLTRTEAAYQRQMVALRERLQPAVEQTESAPAPQYEVRIAGEVEAWLDEAGAKLGLNGSPPDTGITGAPDELPAETAVLEADPVEVENVDETVLAAPPAVEALVEEQQAEAWQPAPEEDEFDAAEFAALTAQVRLLDEVQDGRETKSSADVADLIQLAPEETQPAEAAAGQAELSGGLDDEAAHELAAISEVVDELAKVSALEELIDEAQESEAVAEVIEDLAMLDAAADVDDEVSPTESAVEIVGDAAGEIGAADLLEDVLPADISEIPGDEAAEEIVAEQVGLTEYEGRWPELEDQARQRVLVRRLGAELDADYLDDEELLREMGMAPDVSAFGTYPFDEQEDMMGGSGLVTDPLEEMARHLAAQAETGEPEVTAQGSEASEIASDVWETLVHGQGRPSAGNGKRADEAEGAAAIEGAEADEAVAAAEQEGTSSKEELPAQAAAVVDMEVEVKASDEEEDAMIAATVAAILSRVPDQEAYTREQQQVESEYLPRTNGKPHNGTNGAGNTEPEPAETVKTKERVQKTAVPDYQPVVKTVTLGAPAPALALAAEETAVAEMVMELPAVVWEREPISWEAEYFANTKLAEEPAVVRKDKEIDFDWGGRPPAQGVPARTFSVRWCGAMALEPGEYRFSISAPDGVRLWLNDRLMISAWYDQSMQEYHRDIVWNGGTLYVKLEHYENGGDARAFLTWERTG